MKKTFRFVLPILCLTLLLAGVHSVGKQCPRGGSYLCSAAGPVIQTTSAQTGVTPDKGPTQLVYSYIDSIHPKEFASSIYRPPKAS